jgi:IS5 family transposase
VAVVVTGANRHAMKKLADLLGATVVEPAPTGPPQLVLDRGYDYASCRDAAVARGYTPHAARAARGERGAPPPAAG